MKNFRVFFSIASFFLVLFSDSGWTISLAGLAHFEVLNDSDRFVTILRESRTRRVKREADLLRVDFDLAEKLHQVVFNISAFDKIFRVKITNSGSAVNQRLLTTNFQLFRVSADGNRRESKVELEHFFTGVLEDDEGDPMIAIHSEVFGYVDKLGNAMLTIKTPNDTYTVEPFHRLAGKADRHGDYVIYRISDLRLPNNSSFCGAMSAVNHGPSYQDIFMFSRSRRDATSDPPPSTPPSPDTAPVLTYSINGNDASSNAHDSCELCLTADYTFYEVVAHSDETAATNYMIYLVSQVNNIYRKTRFGRDGELLNYGFTIKRIEVHDQPTFSTENPSRRHFNAKQAVWDQGALLESFARTGNHTGCCLSHLFTHRPFEGGVLGLAYLANADLYKVGGICSSAGSFYVNTGWSSTMFADSSTVPSQQAVLVLAHELGHNWGSPHDLDTKECAPSSNFGGKYIMWMYSVPGYEGNNWRFSPCSLSAIGEVIKAKGDNCFKPRPRALCGNGFLEQGEQCDAGPAGLRDEDRCCNADCTLRANAKCSDANQVCCRGCRPASSETLCWRENELSSQSSTCLGRAFCNGTTAECQPREPLSGKACFDNGQCQNGTCLPFCESHGYRTCMCDKVELACNYCCFVNGTCQPLILDESGPKRLANGRPCPYGVCQRGICRKTMMNTVEKFWSYLTQIDVNNLEKFMRDNIVGVTIVIALIVWIPLSCAVWCLDRRQEKMLDETWNRRERYPGEMVERKSKIYYLPRPGLPAPRPVPVATEEPVLLKNPSPQPPGASSLTNGHGFYNRVFSLSPSQLTATSTVTSNGSGKNGGGSYPLP